MARTLVQALEGISFPCDRSRIVEYARQHDVAPRALEFLEQLPDQRFQDMTALFRALPSKSQRRPRINVVSSPSGRGSAERQVDEDLDEDRPEEQQARQQSADEDMEGGAEQFDQEQPEQPRQEQSAAAPWTAPAAQWQPAFDQSANQLFQASLQWQRFWLEWLNRSVEIYGRALSDWTRR